MMPLKRRGRRRGGVGGGGRRDEDEDEEEGISWDPEAPRRQFSIAVCQPVMALSWFTFKPQNE